MWVAFARDSITKAFLRNSLFFPNMRSMLPKVNVDESNSEQGQATISTDVNTGNTFPGSAHDQYSEERTAMENNPRVKNLLHGCTKELSVSRFFSKTLF